MSNFDYITKENIKSDNPHWLKIPDHQYRILIIGGSGFRKRNIIFFTFYLNCYLAAPQPTLGHYRGGSLTHRC